MIGRVLLAATLITASVSEVGAASFDCSRASTSVERLICDDPTLSAADEAMVDAFQALRDSDPTLASDQIDWLAERDRCETVECLSSAYLARIDQLEDRKRQAQLTPLPLQDSGPAPQEASTAEMPPAAVLKSQPDTSQGAETVEKPQSAQEPKTPRQPRTLQERAQTEAGQLVLLGVALFLLAMLALGASHRVVIYYDLIDFTWSFTWIISLLVAVFLGGLLLYREGDPDPTLTGMTVIGVSTVISIVSFIKVFWNSVRYNRSLPVGLIVGVFKIIFGVTFVLFLALASQSNQQQPRRRRQTNWLVAALAAFLVAVLYRSAINGPEVYARRGWPPPY